MVPTMRGVLYVVLLTGLGAPVWDTCAFAQRPRSLFGSGPSATGQELTFNASIGAGAASNVLASDAAPAPGQTAIGFTPQAPATVGMYGGGGAGLSYSLDRSRITFAASASSSARYYPGVLNDAISSHVAHLSGTWAPSRRTTLSFGQTIAYQPLYTVSVLPRTANLDQPFFNDQNFGAVRDVSLVFTSTVDWTYEISRRMSAWLRYGHQQGHYRGFGTTQSSDTGGGGLSYSITRDLSARFGYLTSRGEYIFPDSPNQRYQTDNFDIGVDFNKGLSLSLSRRTTLSFHTGSSIVHTNGSSRFRVTGNAELTRQWSRDWTSALTYTRDVGFVEAFTDPVLADAVVFSVNGFVGRRIQSSSYVGDSLGDVGLGANRNPFNTAYASSSLTFGLTRNLAVNVGYSYYFYRFNHGQGLPPGVPRELNGQGVQVALELWQPLFSRARRPNAAR